MVVNVARRVRGAPAYGSDLARTADAWSTTAWVTGTSAARGGDARRR
ncbi:hypothetical protein ACH46G_17855 [Micromonospora aurantiaca]